MSTYNFTNPGNASSSPLTYIVGLIIAALVFILLYKSTSDVNEDPQQAIDAVEATEIAEAQPTETTDAPYKPSSSSSSASSSATTPQQPAATQQQPADAGAPAEQPAAAASTPAQQQPAPANTQQPVNDPARVFTFSEIDENPEFPGGSANMRSWMSSNLHYPAPAAERGIQGTVKVQFTVSRTGAISNVKVIQSVDTYLDAEAVRLVKSMPNWTPGKLNGQTVNVNYVLPVKFQLQ